MKEGGKRECEILKNGMRETKGYTTNETLLSISLSSGFSDINIYRLLLASVEKHFQSQI